MSQVAVINQAGLPGLGAKPAHLSGKVAVTNEFAAGIEGGFPIMTYRGKVWRVRSKGVEHDLLRQDGSGEPVQSINVVMIKASAYKSKIFYPGGFEDGSNKPPDCFSSNSITADPAASNCPSPNRTCASCPMNILGSAQSVSGKPARACRDNKRTAIVPGDLAQFEEYGGPLLLRIPPASLTALMEYSEMLSKQGTDVYDVITRIKFDIKENHQQFIFEPVRYVTDQESAAIMELRDDPRVSRILNETVEFSGAGAEAGTASGVSGAQAASATVDPAAQAAAVAAAKAATAAREKAEMDEAQANRDRIVKAAEAAKLQADQIIAEQTKPASEPTVQAVAAPAPQQAPPAQVPNAETAEEFQARMIKEAVAKAIADTTAKLQGAPVATLAQPVDNVVTLPVSTGNVQPAVVQDGASSSVKALDDLIEELI